MADKPDEPSLVEMARRLEEALRRPNQQPPKNDPLADQLGIPRDTRSEAERAADAQRQYREYQRSQMPPDDSKQPRDIPIDVERQPSSDDAPPPKSGASDKWIAQFFEFAGLAFILGPPGFLGEALLKSEPINLPLMVAIFVGFWAIGGVSLAAGLTWPAWKPSNKVGAAVIEKAASSVWIWASIGVAIAFGPALLVAGFSRTMTVEKPAGNFGGVFAEDTQPQANGDLNWNDALYIESAFMRLPRPCVVRLSPASNTAMNSRNILAKIISEHESCKVVDSDRDQSLVPTDIDKPAPPATKGLIVRWHAEYDVAVRPTFSMFKGNFCPVVEGHAMPNDSPSNLVWIVIGEGFPW